MVEEVVVIDFLIYVSFLLFWLLLCTYESYMFKLYKVVDHMVGTKAQNTCRLINPDNKIHNTQTKSLKRPNQHNKAPPKRIPKTHVGFNLSHRSPTTPKSDRSQPPPLCSRHHHNHATTGHTNDEVARTPTTLICHGHNHAVKQIPSQPTEEFGGSHASQSHPQPATTPYC